jgi:hypothetical protein
VLHFIPLILPSGIIGERKFVAATAITEDVSFTHAPLATGNNKVAVHFPATFDASKPFLLCLFIHGIDLPGVPHEQHIQQAIRQMGASATNVMLVAPRFNQNDPGTFATPGVFGSFIAELQSVIPPLLEKAGMAKAVAATVGAFAAMQAPMVISAFSGGWKPLGAILENLPVQGVPAKRVAGVQLLDAVYEDWYLRYAFVPDWMSGKGAQTALVSIFSSTTAGHAKEGNEHLLRDLRPGEMPKPAASAWSLLPNPLPPGTIAFFEMSTSHPHVPSDGPPANPIASFLSLFGDRLNAFVAV